MRKNQLIKTTPLKTSDLYNPNLSVELVESRSGPDSKIPQRGKMVHTIDVSKNSPHLMDRIRSMTEEGRRPESHLEKLLTAHNPLIPGEKWKEEPMQESARQNIVKQTQILVKMCAGLTSSIHDQRVMPENKCELEYRSEYGPPTCICGKPYRDDSVHRRITWFVDFEGKCPLIYTSAALIDHYGIIICRDDSHFFKLRFGDFDGETPLSVDELRNTVDWKQMIESPVLE